MSTIGDTAEHVLDRGLTPEEAEKYTPIVQKFCDEQNLTLSVRQLHLILAKYLSRSTRTVFITNDTLLRKGRVKTYDATTDSFNRERRRDQFLNYACMYQNAISNKIELDSRLDNVFSTDDQLCLFMAFRVLLENAAITAEDVSVTELISIQRTALYMITDLYPTSFITYGVFIGTRMPYQLKSISDLIIT